MSDGTKIEWTDATWSPVVGCTHVSDGCDHCYAATLAGGRLKHLPLYADLTEDGRFNGKVKMLPERLSMPLRWRKPRRIFVNSMSDLFHEGVSDDFIAHVFAIAVAAPEHTFQILTKRHARMRSLLSSLEHAERVAAHLAKLWQVQRVAPLRGPVPNIHLGVSVENQQWADIRIPALLDTPAAVRWISAEPLLGPIDLRLVRGLDGQYGHAGSHFGVGTDECPLGRHHHHDDRCTFPLDWVVVGGESGRAARPMHPAWARSLRDQCTGAGVPFLFKQWGEWAPESVLATRRGAGNAQYIEFDGSTRPAAVGARGAAVTVQRNGKGATGRELDGRTHDEYPAVTL
jgi:protein gp37